MNWPFFSPSLNTIENIWSWMKEWTCNHYSMDKLTYDNVRETVQKAWETMPEDYIIGLLRSIRKRCEAVIAADGMYTKF